MFHAYSSTERFQVEANTLGMDIKCSNLLGPINYFEYGKGHNASIGFSIVSLQSGQWKFRLTVSSNMVTRGLIRNNEIRRRR